MSDHGRIHLLNNGRSPAKASGDFITVAKAQAMVEAALQFERAENEKMVKWYCSQLPELVARMVSDALAANGLTMLPPSWQALPPADGGTNAS